MDVGGRGVIGLFWVKWLSKAGWGVPGRDDMAWWIFLCRVITITYFSFIFLPFFSSHVLNQVKNESASSDARLRVTQGTDAGLTDAAVLNHA